MEYRGVKELEAKKLEVQAQYEHSLAARQTDPKLKRLIANSAIGKEESAHELRTGQPISPESSRYEKRLEHSRPHKVTVATC